jgi:thioredoxin 1
VESVADEYRGRIRVLALDTEASPAASARYGVRGLPTLLFFRDGELVDRAVGALTRPALKARFEALLGAQD